MLSSIFYSILTGLNREEDGNVFYLDVTTFGDFFQIPHILTKDEIITTSKLTDVVI